MRAHSAGRARQVSKTIAARCVVRDIQTGRRSLAESGRRLTLLVVVHIRVSFASFSEAVDTENRQAALLQMIGVLAELERYPYQRTNPRGSEGRKWPEREICQMWLIF